MDRKQKRRRTNSGESGERNLEVGSVRSRAESTRGCVKLKTVIEIRRSSAREAPYLHFFEWFQPTNPKLRVADCKRVGVGRGGGGGKRRQRLD